MPTQETPIKETLTIQEMARQSGLSEHTLRCYERIGLLTPNARDRSSSHRRYSAETVSIVESLSCLRGTGMSLNDIPIFLRLRQQGSFAATGQKELFAAHLAAVTEEMEQMKVRMEYLADQVAYWTAVEAGNMDEAELAKEAARRLMPVLTRKKITQ